MSTASSVQQMTLALWVGAQLMIAFGPFCIAHFLVVAGKCVVETITVSAG
jgi:hypothetical protein